MWCSGWRTGRRSIRTCNCSVVLCVVFVAISLFVVAWNELRGGQGTSRESSFPCACSRSPCHFGKAVVCLHVLVSLICSDCTVSF